MVETPMIPMLPAIATRSVLLNLDHKLDIDNPVAVKKDIDDCFFPFSSSLEGLSSSPSKISKFIKIYDTSNYMELLLNESQIDKIKLKNKLGQESILKKIMIRMLKRFIEVRNEGFDINEDKLKKEFIDFCKNFGILVKDDTELVKKTSLMYDLYNTKINISEFEKWLDDSKITFDENLDNILYEDVIYNLKMNCDDEEMITAKQFI